MKRIQKAASINFANINKSMIFRHLLMDFQTWIGPRILSAEPADCAYCWGHEYKARFCNGRACFQM